MITVIELSGFLHFIVAFFVWYDIPGLMVASLTMFCLLLDSGVTTRAIAAYWVGYILGVMVHPYIHIPSVTNTLMHFIVNLNATYGCSVAVVFAIAVALSKRRTPRPNSA